MLEIKLDRIEPDRDPTVFYAFAGGVRFSLFIIDYWWTEPDSGMKLASRGTEGKIVYYLRGEIKDGRGNID